MFFSNEFLQILLSFILLLGILVFVHEFGHFIVAKLFGVRVEVFSIGFGPKISSFTKGDTNYRISWIPLGGYVKMFGDNYDDEVEPSERKRAYITQPPHKKALIAFAGPLFNFLLAIFIYQITFFSGVPTVLPEVGYVLPKSPAHNAGLQSKDKLIGVDGKKFESWKDFVGVISKKAGVPVELVIERKKVQQKITIVPALEEGADPFGQKVMRGMIGVNSSRTLGSIALTDSQKLAAMSGFKNGDVIKQVNDCKINVFRDLDCLVDLMQAREDLTFKIQRESIEPKEQGKPEQGKSEDKQALEIMISSDKYKGLLVQSFEDALKTLGVERSGVLVKGTLEDGPGQKAGIEPYDKLVSFDNKPVDSIWTLSKFLQDPKKSTFPVSFLRNGQVITRDIKLQKKTTKNVLGMEKTSWIIGIHLFPEFQAPAFFEKRILNPFKSFYLGALKTFEISKLMLIGIWKLITGDVSLKMLGGPMTIAKFANESVKIGFLAFLNTLALISINLALVNLLPIPVLDGGHLTICAIEAITRRPINKRLLGIAYGMGFWIIMSLILVSLYSDFVRFGAQILNWLKLTIGM